MPLPKSTGRIPCADARDHTDSVALTQLLTLHVFTPRFSYGSVRIFANTSHRLAVSHSHRQALKEPSPARRSLTGILQEKGLLRICAAVR